MKEVIREATPGIEEKVAESISLMDFIYKHPWVCVFVAHVVVATIVLMMRAG